MFTILGCTLRVQKSEYVTECEPVIRAYNSVIFGWIFEILAAIDYNIRNPT